MTVPFPSPHVEPSLGNSSLGGSRGPSRARGGWVGLRQGVTWSPTHGPRCLPYGTRLGGRTRVSNHKAYRTVDRPQTPQWHSRAGDAACLCVCALVCLRGGGGGGAHLLVPLLFGVGAPGAGKCVPGAPGPGREAGEPDAEPAGGEVGLSSQPPRHKAKLPSRSTTACRHGKAVVRGVAGVRPTLLDCPRHRWCCHMGWVWPPTAEGVPRAGGAPGHRECFPAQGGTGASCTACGATARVDEGGQRAPHPNGLSVARGVHEL